MSKNTGGGKMAEMYELVQDIQIAMLTTRPADGRLVSRPMATQKPQPDADLWFVTNRAAHKVEEIAADPQVNVAYYNSKTREWVSLSGVARVSQDRARIRQLYQPDWKMWFGDEGGEMDGGPDDPRLALLLVNAESAVYATATTTRAGALVEMAKSFVKGEEPDLLRIEKLEGGSTA
ncbi:MAG: pyridoxamine 5'-phosphate oxidase family protein [Longimicrobiales bacterium]